jgi:hypothetical protein
MRCYVSCIFRPHLPVEVGFEAATCSAALDLTSEVSSGAATWPVTLGFVSLLS